jgi:hypothetical protein
VVLNVDLIPNMIDTVMIGDRLFSLPIPVEGRVKNEEHEVQMDLDEGAGDPVNGHGKPSNPSGKSPQGTQKHDKPEESSLKMIRRVEENRVIVHQKRDQVLKLIMK